jgi:hypothetical protein
MAGLAMAVLMGGGLATAAAAGPALAQTPSPAPGVGLAAAAPAPPAASSVYMAYTGTDRAAYLRNEVNGSVIALGGQLIGGPAVAQTTIGLAVFGRGTDNALWWKHQTTGGTWSSWQSLGGVITSQPGAAGMVPGAGAAVVLARGTNGALWFRTQGSGGRWSTWQSFGGRLLPGTGPAAVNTQAGGLVVAVTGTDHQIRLWGPMGMQVYGFVNLGGLTSGTPGITTLPGTARVIVFARGTNNAMWYKQSILPIGSLGGWASLGGVLTTGPAAATKPAGDMYVFVLGVGGVPYVWSGTAPSTGSWAHA